jgi:hypothetical protein
VSELRRHLALAPAAFLEGALDNPALTIDEMHLLLRNRHATPAVLARVGRDPRWIRRREVRRGLVLHPATPLSVSRNLVPHLSWSDLAEACGNPRLAPVLRRRAEDVLRSRLEEITLGERVALAHRASRGLIATLVEDGESRVLEGLLGNARLVESDVVRIAGSSAATAALLAALAVHPEWGKRRKVRLAVLRNPRTPVPAALSLLRRLHARDLRPLADAPGFPRIVRVGAERELSRSEPTESAGKLESGQDD